MAVNFTKQERVLLGRRIQEARLCRGLTQDQVAEACDCTVKHISDIERGVVGPSFPLIAKVGKILDTGVDFFLQDIFAYCAESSVDRSIAQVLQGCDPETKAYCIDILQASAAFARKVKQQK